MADLKNDIEKYLRDELSPAERHALEMKALSDPFLADALEGGESISRQDFSVDLKKLKTTLDERVLQKGKVIPIWIWPARIAAGLLLMAVSTYIILNLVTEKEKSSDLALNKKEVMPQQFAEKNADSIATTPTSEPAENLLSMEKQKETKPSPSVAFHATEQQPIAAISSEAAGPTPEPMNKPQAIADEILVLPDVASEKKIAQALQGYTNTKLEAKDDAAEQTRKTDSRAAGASAKTKTADLDKLATKKIITGLVTDAEDGTPLPGVDVLIKGSTEGTVTDGDGHYQLALNTPKAYLVFSFIGLQRQEVAVVDSTTVNVQLAQDVSELSEIVVTGYADKKEGDEEEESLPILTLAEPGGGRKAFKKYLEESVHYPEQAIENNIEGKVTIQFTIETNGQLTDFRVLKGIGHGCDEEVIRLIQDGPKWTPTKRDAEPVKGKVKVRLRFALPD